MARLRGEKPSVFPCKNGDAQKRLLEKSFQTECIVTWYPGLCVAQGLVFINTVLPFFSLLMQKWLLCIINQKWVCNP